MSVAADISVDVDPFSHDFLADPYRYHSALRDAGPVVWLSAYGIYGMARFAEVSAALQDWRTFTSARGVGLADFAREKPWRPPSLLLETDPPVHDRTRALMSKIVSLGALKALRPVWEAKADALVAALAARGSFDAVTDLGETFPMMVFPDTIGLQEAGRHHLLPYAAAAFNAFGPRNDIFEAGNAAAAEAIVWVAEACKRENLRAGGWGMAVYESADRGDCTPDEAERLVRSFLTAGIDTTVNGISNLVYALATHPEQWARLRADPGLVRRAIEESLRWLSTAQTFFRTTSRDTAVSGVEMPEGSKVLLFLAAANRDPRKWGVDAERFDIGRMTSGHVGFGFGIHQCLGQMVARLEAQVVLEALLRRVDRIEMAGAPERKLNNTLFVYSRLPVRVS